MKLTTCSLHLPGPRSAERGRTQQRVSMGTALKRRLAVAVFVLLAQLAAEKG
jgi:hypothetical protein